ncbi:MAG: S41 family peptidase [Legionella sp.]
MYCSNSPLRTLLLILILLFFYPLQLLATNENSRHQHHIPVEEVERFSNVLGQIKKYYVRPTSDKELFDHAIRGMLNGLDPHSTYLDEQDFKELQSATQGEFGGLGLEVTLQDGMVKIITPLVDTPAYQAGIQAGDIIIKLDNQLTQGIGLKHAVNLMRGPIGSKIVLTILRQGEKEPLKFKIVRQKIVVQSVNSKLIDHKYGYIRLSQFQAQTAIDMKQAIAQLTQQAGGKLQGAILDLRNNPGGLLDSAIAIADSFISNDNVSNQEIIVYTQGRLPGSKFTAIATPGDILEKTPIIVLINSGSASASEIVAGALQDHKRAIIVGTRSFGKGSVQTVLPLDEKHAIKLTTALYYTPSGTSIQAKGITPDIMIENINVPKASAINESRISETSLNHHQLTNHDDRGLASIRPGESSNLLHEDYQLYTALTVLKGLSIVGH